MRPVDADLESRPLTVTNVGSEPVPKDAALDLSVLVLLSRDGRRVSEILSEYAPALREMGISFEFLFVAGPESLDLQTEKRAPDLGSYTVRLLEVGHQVDQSAMLRLALANSRGRIILTLPPELRVAADALPKLVQGIEAGNDVTVARRWPRHDGLLNRLQGSGISWLVNFLAGVRLHDLTCRVQTFRRAVLEEIPLYGSYFRFLPVVAERQGFRVAEIPVRQHPGGGRTRVYKPLVYLGWLIDILGVYFVLRFTYRPLRFFGSLGATFALVGGIILSILFVQKLGGQGIANRPMLVLGVLMLTLGVQSVALGLIGEIVVHFQAARGSLYRLGRRDTPKSS